MTDENKKAALEEEPSKDFYRKTIERLQNNITKLNKQNTELLQEKALSGDQEVAPDTKYPRLDEEVVGVKAQVFHGVQTGSRYEQALKREPEAVGDAIGMLEGLRQRCELYGITELPKPPPSFECVYIEDALDMIEKALKHEADDQGVVPDAERPRVGVEIGMVCDYCGTRTFNPDPRICNICTELEKLFTAYPERARKILAQGYLQPVEDE